MACAGCKEIFRDKGGTVTRSTYHKICYGCMLKAVQAEEADPKELIHLYEVLKSNGIHIPKILIDELYQDIEWRMNDPLDRMFNPRG